MAKKPKIPNGFVLFDVLYEDGTRTSNRKVPAAEIGGLDGDEPARVFVESQDRHIGEKSGIPRARIKTILRSDAKPPRDRSSRTPASADKL